MKRVIEALYILLTFAYLITGDALDLSMNCTSICDQVESLYPSDQVDCDFACQRKTCLDGCSNWETSAESSCQDICHQNHAWHGDDNVGCSLGCVIAMQTYANKVKGYVDELEAPQLVGGAITPTSVGLRWKGTQKIPGIKHLVQFRQGNGSGEWLYYQPKRRLNGTEITVKYLKPYTKYQFRVAWILVANQLPLFSNLTPWISTRPSGPPQSPPRNVRATPLDWSRIEMKWDEPLFPGGSLLFYTIYLGQENVPGSIRKDINANHEKRFVVSGLNANTTYLVQVTATNQRGEGPAAQLHATTYPAAPAVADSRGYLLLSSGSNLLKLGLDIMEQPQFLFNTSSRFEITGLALHISLKLVYMSDAGGSIYQMLLNTKIQRELLTKVQLGGFTADLSVDWLYGQLYIVLQTQKKRPKSWQIWRCDSMGQDLHLVVGRLPYLPQNIQADPYNGYLWWISNGIESGLHRLLLSNSFPSENFSPKVVYRNENLGGLTLDPINFRVLVADQAKNTMLGVSLDGTSVTDLRNNTQQPFFNQVSSIAFLNGKFYWTNSKEVFTEEVNENMFYHNSYALLGKGAFGHLLAVHRSGQPVPVPLNPPREVQALFTQNSATIIWIPPKTPALMGEAAWEDWLYELQIQEGEKVLHRARLNETRFLLRHLTPATSYSIKVRAYSTNGEGPWSKAFYGRSLSSSFGTEKLLWKTEEEILITDIDGSNASLVSLQETIKEGITHITFFRDTLVMCSPRTNCYAVSITTKEATRILGMEGVYSTAVDWATNRVFGIHLKNNSIVWSSLEYGKPGLLGLLIPALELKVDSFRGLLYWRTRYGVFKSTLTGKNVTHVYEEDIFSEKFVYGLALDLYQSEIWWVIKSKDGCHLYRQVITGSIHGDGPHPRLLSHSMKEGSLSYASERLFWLSEDLELIIYDPFLDSAAIIRSGVLNVHFIAVRVDSPLGKDYDIRGLMPETINSSSVRTVGTWQNFSIMWDPLSPTPLAKMQSNLQYKLPPSFDGDLRYKITILGPFKKGVYMSEQNHIVMPWLVDPYSKFTVSIRGITNWAEGENVVVPLRSPSDIPSRPTHLRAFSNHNGGNYSISLRWNQPSKLNGKIENYNIKRCVNSLNNCTLYCIPGNHLETEELYTEQPDKFIFEVWASTYVGDGPSSVLEIETPAKLLPAPVLLISASSSISILDADTKRFHALISNDSAIGVRSVVVQLEEKNIIWMDTHSDIYRMSLNGKGNRTRIGRINDYGHLLSYDWIRKALYWLEDGSGQSKSLHRFDFGFRKQEVVQNFPIFKKLPLAFMLSPSHSTVYLLMMRKGTTSLRVVSIDDGSTRDWLYDNPVTDADSECMCPKSTALLRSAALDTSLLEPQFLYIVMNDEASWGDFVSSILKVDLQSGCCTTVARLNDFGHVTCDIIAVDTTYLYCYEATSMLLVWFPKSGIVKKGNFHRLKLTFKPTSLIPLNKGSQPRPDYSCLMVTKHSIVPYLEANQVTSLTLRVPSPPSPSPECNIASRPASMIVIYFNKVSTTSASSCANSVKECHTIKSRNTTVIVDGLLPFTKYVIRVAFQTVYNLELGRAPAVGPPTFFKTKARAPTGANIVTATPKSPEEIKVSFEAPTELPFEIHWISHSFTRGFSEMEKTKYDQKVTMVLKHLSANTRYEIWVRIYSEDDPNLFTDSPKVTALTFPDPPDITILQEGSRNLKVQWTSPATRAILRHSLQYQQVGVQTWNTSSIEETQPEKRYVYDLDFLHPASVYNFRLNIFYDTTEYEAFTWPKDNKFQFTTSGEVPSSPDIVRLQKSDARVEQESWVAWWGESAPNGSPILAYELQVALQKKEFDESSENLTFSTVYNDTANSWPININEFDNPSNYFFRVRAINDLGESEWCSQNVILPFAGPSTLDTIHLPSILGAAIPSCIMLFIILLLLLTISIRRAERKRQKAKSISMATQSSGRGRELELSSLPHHLSHNNNFVSEENILYSMHTFPGDEIDLPHVSRHCITRTKFLGSGAFGEVYEGVATGLSGCHRTTKIAIKTLRKGATETAKREFLKEAQLMSHFQHDHILRLLAVCTDNEQFCLILELMEGGDLLSYLRTNRRMESGFTLLDLLSMCVDVARGCVYLEEMHFVHRDLAARNCLVSSIYPFPRIVKIGDFGLARDIYKNDYYRKGEGFLPVRWMSPESLIDGVFTTQSDVWAFGVLLWEILTLGQQPYPARSNLEVLDYVKSGGKPSTPPNCPEDLHNLTQRCWSYSPEGRPTFKACLAVLLVLKESVSNLPTFAVHNVNYISSNGISGLDNLAYAFERDENLDTNSGTLPLEHSYGGLKCIEGDSTSGASTMPLTVPLQQQQHYLQLVNDTSFSLDATSTPRIKDEVYETPIRVLSKEFQAAEISSKLFSSVTDEVTSTMSRSCHVYISTTCVDDPPQAEILNTVPPRSIVGSESKASVSSPLGYATSSNSNLAAKTLITPSTKENVARMTTQEPLGESLVNFPHHEYCLPQGPTSWRSSKITSSSGIERRQNSLPNFGSSRTRKLSLSSLPSSPRSPTATGAFLSPASPSPLSVTFTFPIPVLGGQSAVDHYMKPVNNRSCEALSEEGDSALGIESPEDLEQQPQSPQIWKGDTSDSGNASESPSSDKVVPLPSHLGYNSYVSMSGGTANLPQAKRNIFINGSINDESQLEEERCNTFLHPDYVIPWLLG